MPKRKEKERERQIKRSVRVNVKVCIEKMKEALFRRWEVKTDKKRNVLLQYFIFSRKKDGYKSS